MGKRFGLPWEISRPAIRAVLHVMERAKAFDSQMMPIIVEEVGLGGSAALGAESPADIDIVVVVRGRRGPAASEWGEFRSLLRKTFFHVLQYIEGVRFSHGRASMDLVIELFREELEDLGFEPRWLKQWMPWVRVSDYRRAQAIGFLTDLIDERKLVDRYLRYRWWGPRLEIHVQGEYSAPWDEIPALMLWRRGSGAVRPSLGEIEDFIVESHRRAREAALKIVEGSTTGLAEIYHVVTRVLSRTARPADPGLARLHSLAERMLRRSIREMGREADVNPCSLGEHRLLALRPRLLEKRAVALALLVETLESETLACKAWSGESPVETALRVYLASARRLGLSRHARSIIQELARWQSSP